MIDIGVGTDYAPIVVIGYRDSVRRRRDPEAATAVVTLLRRLLGFCGSRSIGFTSSSQPLARHRCPAPVGRVGAGTVPYRWRSVRGVS